MLGSLIRSAANKAGYIVTRRAFQRWGVDPFLDVSRLASAWDCGVRVAFDVGANIGQTAKMMVRAFPGASIHSFEPHPASFQTLAREAPAGVFAHPLALSDGDGRRPFFVFGNDGGAALRNSLTPCARSSVEFDYSATRGEALCSRLDTFCSEQKIGRVDLLKIDVEGCELQVLHGAEGMLRAGLIRFVYLEYNDLLAASGADGGALLPIAEYLGAFGLRYIASYTDFVTLENPARPFVVSNALFALPPQ